MEKLTYYIFDSKSDGEFFFLIIFLIAKVMKNYICKVGSIESHVNIILEKTERQKI